MPERMSAIDSYFIYAEDDAVNHMHLLGWLVFEGPPPPFDDVVAMMGSKLPNLRRFRQVMKPVPLELGRPVWVDVPTVDLADHLHHAVVPAPGDDNAVEQLLAQLMSTPLDRRRPLWNMWMIEGLPDDRWALASMTHHAMIDGVSGTDMTSVLLDRTPDESYETDGWESEPAPSAQSLASEAMLESAWSGPALLRTIGDAVWPPQRLGELASGSASSARRASARGSAESLNGKVGPGRRVALTQFPLATIKQIRAATGGTVNDVVLAAATRGFRDLLEHRGLLTKYEVVRVLMPVALHARDEQGRAVHAGDGKYENRATTVVVDLPVSVADPLERLTTVRAQVEAIKSSAEVGVGDVMGKFAGFIPSGAMAAGIRASAALPAQTTLNSVVSNVPGPPTALFAAGRRLVEAYPVVPLFPVGARMSIGAWSYDSILFFGLNADATSSADVDVLRDGLRAGFEELVPLKGERRPGKRTEEAQ